MLLAIALKAKYGMEVHVCLYNYHPVSTISSVWMALFIQKYVKKNMTIKQLCLLRKGSGARLSGLATGGGQNPMPHIIR